MARPRKYEDVEILTHCALLATNGETVSVRTVLQALGGNSLRVSKLVAKFNSNRFDDTMLLNQRLTIQLHALSEERAAVVSFIDRLEDKLKASVEAYETELTTRLRLEEELTAKDDALKVALTTIDQLRQELQVTRASR